MTSDHKQEQLTECVDAVNKESKALNVHFQKIAVLIF